MADIERWVNGSVTRKVEYWLQRNSIENFLGTGTAGGVTQPALMLVLHKQVSYFSNEWHVNHMGSLYAITNSLDEIAAAKLVHWNGSHKPWKKKMDVNNIAHKKSRWFNVCIAEPPLLSTAGSEPSSSMSSEFVLSRLQERKPVIIDDSKLLPDDIRQLRKIIDAQIADNYSLDCKKV